MSTFLDYLDEISGGATQTDLAKAADVDQSNVSRWKRGSKPSPETVIRLAHHYRRPVHEALYRSGLITEETAQRLRVGEVATLSDYPNAALLREIERRMEPRTSEVPDTITSPADYGEEPIPDDYELAAGTVAREDDHLAD